MSKRKPNPLKGQWGGDAGLQRVMWLCREAAHGRWSESAYDTLTMFRSWVLAFDPKPRGNLERALNGVGRRYRPRLPTKAERERCGAYARSTGKPCQAPCCKRPDGSLANRCRMHGGLSTGPKTEPGKRRALQNLKQNRIRAPETG